MGDIFKDFLESCTTLWRNFNNCRSHFPSMTPDLIGKKEILAAPFYISQGFNVKFIFDQGFSKADMNSINQIAHWLNQNFIIRLYAILNCFHLISDNIDIDFSAAGAVELNIVRRLRNCFSHSSGRFDSQNQYHVDTMKMIHEKLNIEIDSLADWPLSINTILKPLMDGCVKYASSKMSIKT